MTFDDWWETLETREKYKLDKALTTEAWKVATEAERESCALVAEIELLRHALLIAYDAMLEADKHFSETSEKCLGLAHGLHRVHSVLMAPNAPAAADLTCKGGGYGTKHA